MFVEDGPGHDEHTTTETATVVGTDQTTDQGTEIDHSSASEETRHDTEAEEDETDDSTTTFSRSYVEKLRRENANYREKANRSDELAARLHAALVAATGRMADPTDLPFDTAHLDDENALNTAIDELLSAKPHLASRQLSGDIGQGNRGNSSAPAVDLAAMLRAHA